MDSTAVQMNDRCKHLFREVAASALLLLTSFGLYAAELPSGKELQELKRENQSLQQQLRTQQSVIEQLGEKVSRLEKSDTIRANYLERPESAVVSQPLGPGKTVLSGEGGAAFFLSESRGPFPNAEFRLDELKLFLDATVIENVYFFAELNLTSREEGDYFHLGEAYLDFENVSRLWGRDQLLNIRFGRIDVPFGEEYVTRDAIDNSLISHSVADLWAVDEGIEFYGSWNKFDYVAGVFNGGNAALRDFTSDKSIVGRVGFGPTRWLRLSVSAMRTGDLAAEDDGVSSMWIGNGFFRSIGSTNTTLFHANLIEGDVQARWKRGHVKAAGGAAWYDDNDSTMRNKRDLYYYYVEGKQSIWDKFYVAGRFSQIFTSKGGYPLVGDGDWREYFRDELTEELWRLSLGIGYRWNQNLLLKAEYTFNGGKVAGGEKRMHENGFAAEAAFKF